MALRPIRTPAAVRRLFARWFTRERMRPSVFAAIALVATASGLALYFTDPFHQLELKTVDARFQVRGSQRPPASLVIVAIDSQTFNQLGLQWPFARRVHARVLDRITRDGPRAIAFDVQFSERSSRGLADDEALAQAVLNANGKVVLSTTEPRPGGNLTFLGSSGKPLLHALDARAGDGRFPPDADGVLRRMPYSIEQLPGLGVAAAELASGRRIAPERGATDPWIDFYGPPGTISSVSYGDVYQGRLPRGYFHDKTVVIGATAASLQDVHNTSFGFNMAGPEVQAEAIGTALRGFPLRGPGTAVDVIVIALMGMVAPLGSIRLSFRWSLVLMLALAAALTLGVQLAFNAGHILSFVYPVTTLLLASVAALGGHYVLRLFEQVRVRELFARFVPVAVVDDVIGRTDEDLRLGGVRREGTVMFTDLRGFTSFSERLEPERVVQVINRYLGGMTDAIQEHGGTLVAYMGDGIMALWGAPLEQPDHADRALAAAREMLAVRLPGFNAWLAEQGFDHAFRMGIGLNSGSVMSGNVGSARRLEYTAIGDTTNTASRLEGMTKGTEHQLFVADSTRALLGVVPDDLVEVGDLPVRGRNATIKVWTLPEAPVDEPRPATVASESA